MLFSKSMVKLLPNPNLLNSINKTKCPLCLQSFWKFWFRYYNFDAYDLNSKDLSADDKRKIVENDRRFAESSKRFEKNNKRFQNNQRSIIYNGNYVRYEDMTAEQKKGF